MGSTQDIRGENRTRKKSEVEKRKINDTKDDLRMEKREREERKESRG